MTEEITATSWVYVLVQNPGGDEQIVGQHDGQSDISFIPMFKDKESAMQGSMQMVTEKGRKYEIQAIMYEDLERFAAEGGFILFVVDDEGRVVDKRAPNPAK